MKVWRDNKPNQVDGIEKMKRKDDSSRSGEVTTQKERPELLLVIVYSQGSFLSIDRISLDKDGQYTRKRRIIHSLTTKSGSINAILVLELLKLKDGESVSIYNLINNIRTNYFKEENIGTKLITESLNRLLRRTLTDYFAFEGKVFRRRDFELKDLILEPNTDYMLGKRFIEELCREFKNTN